MVSRKAQGLSMNTIIIAAIALVVLVVLIVLVINYTGKVPVATGCQNTGGVCISVGENDNPFAECNNPEAHKELKPDKKYAPHTADCGSKAKTCCLTI